MKIGIISDTHFGFKEDSELELDCYINFEQALRYCVENTDIILMPGDLFDLEEPSQKTFQNVFHTLKEHIGKQKTLALDKKDMLLKVPVVVIAGTHEYKGKGYISPIDVLESAKYIYQLKHNNIVFEKDKEKVNVSGMAGVPEKVAKDILAKLDFKAIENAVNIFMTHQSYNELLTFDDEMISNLSLEDLPKGFDLYINGHIHKKHFIKTEKGPFLIPGSTIITQIKKNEILEKRGFYIYDTKTKDLEFKEIPIQRDYYYLELNEENITKQELINKINAEIEKIKNNYSKYNYAKKEIVLNPVLKIKLSAKLTMTENKSLNEKDFNTENVILILDKKIETEDLKNKIDIINFEQDKINALEKSKEIFLQNLKDAGFKNSFDPEELLILLKDKHPEKTSNFILNKIKQELDS